MVDSSQLLWAVYNYWIVNDTHIKLLIQHYFFCNLSLSMPIICKGKEKENEKGKGAIR